MLSNLQSMSSTIPKMILFCWNNGKGRRYSKFLESSVKEIPVFGELLEELQVSDPILLSVEDCSHPVYDNVVYAYFDWIEKGTLKMSLLESYEYVNLMGLLNYVLDIPRLSQMRIPKPSDSCLKEVERLPKDLQKFFVNRYGVHAKTNVAKFECKLYKFIVELPKFAQFVWQDVEFRTTTLNLLKCPNKKRNSLEKLPFENIMSFLEKHYTAFQSTDPEEAKLLQALNILKQGRLSALQPRGPTRVNVTGSGQAFIDFGAINVFDVSIKKAEQALKQYQEKKARGIKAKPVSKEPTYLLYDLFDVSTDIDLLDYREEYRYKLLEAESKSVFLINYL